TEAPKDPVKIDIMDESGAAVASYTSQPPAANSGSPAPEGIPEEIAAAFGLGPAPRAPANAGLNRFAWNMRYPATFQVPRGAVLWPPGGGPGPRVVPGKYQVKVTIGAWSQTQSFEVKPDPRLSATTADYQEQLKTAREVGGRIKD